LIQVNSGRRNAQLNVRGASGVAMSHYQVRFIKRLHDDSGHSHNCLQGVVDIRRARDSQRAVEAAKHRFARMKRIPRWDLHADLFEVEIDERQPSLPRGRSLTGRS
jgi:hypothetical protein